MAWVPLQPFCDLPTKAGVTCWPAGPSGLNATGKRRAARLVKGEAVLTRLAAAKRKKVDAQKLASTVGRVPSRTVMTSIPPDLEETLKIRKLHKLFTAPPSWIKPDATAAA